MRAWRWRRSRRNSRPATSGTRADLVIDRRQRPRRLLGPPRDDWRRAARARRPPRGMRVHVAVAATARLPRSSRSRVRASRSSNPASEAAALAPLPIGLLEQIRPQNTPSPPKAVDQNHKGSASSAVSAVQTWGIRTLGELAALPPADLAARLGRRRAAWQAIARGEDIAAARARRCPRSASIVRSSSSGRSRRLEPLSFVLTRLLEPLSTRLERRDRGAAVLHVRLRLGPPAERGEIHARRLRAAVADARRADAAHAGAARSRIASAGRADRSRHGRRSIRRRAACCSTRCSRARIRRPSSSRRCSRGSAR